MNKIESVKITENEAIEILRDTPIDIRSTREDDIHALYATAQNMAIEALKLKEELLQEIPNFKEVISANYEMFMKYDVNDHTEIEQIAFDNFDKTVQDLQWLVARLESDTE